MNITFPVIAISDSFLVVDELFNSCTTLGWRNGYFNSLNYFDSEGKLWPVVEAQPAREIGMLDKIFNKKIQINFKLGEPIIDGLAHAKKLLIELVENDPDDLYDQFISHEELISLINNAKNPNELIAVAGNLGAS